jgi:hypothetical protein
MGIDVYWKDENGHILAAVEDPNILSKLIRVFWRQSSSACLRFVDPAGDACFNQQQIPVLWTELRQLLPLIPNDRAKEHINKVIELVEKATQVHTYIWFIGD